MSGFVLVFFSNFVPWDIRLQKCRDLENRVRGRSESWQTLSQLSLPPDRSKIKRKKNNYKWKTVEQSKYVVYCMLRPFLWWNKKSSLHWVKRWLHATLFCLSRRQVPLHPSAGTTVGNQTVMARCVEAIDQRTFLVDARVCMCNEKLHR